MASEEFSDWDGVPGYLVLIEHQWRFNTSLSFLFEGLDLPLYNVLANNKF